MVGGMSRVRSQKGGMGLSSGESRFYSLVIVQPLQSFEPGDQTFGKRHLASTVQHAEGAHISKHGPWGPSCSLGGILGCPLCYQVGCWLCSSEFLGGCFRGDQGTHLILFLLIEATLYLFLPHSSSAELLLRSLFTDEETKIWRGDRV